MLPVKLRIQYLQKLKQEIINRREQIYQALHYDLQKNNFEAEVSEIWPILKELKLYIKNLTKWNQKKLLNHPGKLLTKKISFFSAFTGKKTYSIHEPYGQVLIISPWNYPFYLTFVPIINALGAGNKIFVKPSEYCLHSSQLILEICLAVFEKKYVEVFLGKKEVVHDLLDNRKIDLLFFTGSAEVGQILYQKAATKMIPVILELSGQNPFIVDESANLNIAARKLIWSKFLNSGQTCIAPNFIALHTKIRAKFLQILVQQQKILTDNLNVTKNENVAKIISQKHLNDIVKKFPNLDFDLQAQKINFQILETSLADSNMKKELFCPAIMLVEFDNLEELVLDIQKREKSLALYFFSSDNQNINYVLENLQFGGGCINDVISQVSEHAFGFGGVGKSGIGKYCGYEGFKAFSHQKNIVHFKPNREEKRKYMTLKPNKKILKIIQKISKW